MKLVVWPILLVGIGQMSAWAQNIPVEENEGNSDLQPSLGQSLSGSARTNYFQSSKNFDDEINFYGVTAQLKWLPTFSSTLGGKLEVRATNPDVINDSTIKGTLLEGWITAHFEHGEIRLGKQIVAWGRADGLNPTDNLTPRDYTVLLPFEEDQRFGTFALKSDFYVDTERTLTFFTTPFFEPSKLPRPASSSGPAIEETKPAKTLANSVLGVKLNTTGTTIDWSMSYYHGFSLLPALRLSTSANALEFHYPEIDVLGADVAVNSGRYGFRAEAAYIRPQSSTQDAFVPMRPYFFLVAGVDRTFFENLNLNLQWVWRLVQGYRNFNDIVDSLQHTAAVYNTVTFGQQNRSNHGITMRLSDKWLNDTFAAELLTIANFDPTNFYVRPLVSYEITDHLKASVGADLYWGSAESFYGQLRPNRSIFAELRYSFST